MLHISHDDEVHFVVKFPYSEDVIMNDKDDGSQSPASSSDEWRQPTAIRDLYQHGRAMSTFLDIQSVSGL